MADSRLRVVFCDEAIAMGGSLMVLSHLFKSLDRTKVEPLLVSALPLGALGDLFDPKDVIWSRCPPLNYVSRARWMAKAGNNLILKKFFAHTHALLQMLRNLPFHLELTALIVKTRPDVIHINNGFFPFLVAGLFNFPVVFHLHGMHGSGSKLRRRFVLRSKAYIAISDLIKSSGISAGYPAEKITLIPNPIPPVQISLNKEQLRKKLGLRTDQVVVVHVGRLVPWKGQLEFVKALAAIKARVPPVLALIVGGSDEGFGSEYLEQVQAFVAENGLDAVVRFMGHSSEVLSFMKAADIVVHSSIEPEPFGLVITEAMAMGTAVLASDLGAAREIIETGVDGLIANPLDTPSFGSALLRLICNSDYRATLAQRGRETAISRYGCEAFAEKMTSVYRAAASRPD